LRHVTGARHFSQAIAEGDGISVIAEVADVDAAREAEEQGAEALVLRRAIEGIREATSLPLLWRAHAPPASARNAGADACVLIRPHGDDDGAELERLHREALALGLDCVVEVRDDEEIELALERIDPEIFLLPGLDGDDEFERPLDRALELLPDVPAGKLAIAEIDVAGPDEVAELERAGVDAVIVRDGNVAELVGGAPPEV
jgi:indole-3-glycerol phosphate synthase